MGVQLEEPHQLSSENIANSESIGEAAIVLIAIGTLLIVLCAASVIYGLHRRKRQGIVGGSVPQCVGKCSPNPTDFMNSLATWDRCHSIDDVLEKRRRSKWSLEIFENYGDDNKERKHLQAIS